MSALKKVHILAALQQPSPEERRLAAGIYSALRNSVAPVAVVGYTNEIQIGMGGAGAASDMVWVQPVIGEDGAVVSSSIPELMRVTRQVPGAPRKTYG